MYKYFVAPRDVCAVHKWNYEAGAGGVSVVDFQLIASVGVLKLEMFFFKLDFQERRVPHYKKKNR